MKRVFSIVMLVALLATVSVVQERALLDLKEQYYDKFIKFLTPQQIQKMYQMENAPRARMQNGNMQPPQGGFPGGPMGGMTPPPGMW